MSITFDLDLDTIAGRVDMVGPGIRRVLAPNAGPFTFRGTGTYIVGSGTVAVIDPGPADDAHIAALVRALGNETVSHLVVTHTHADHSPGARTLQALVGGTIVGCAPHPLEHPSDHPSDHPSSGADIASSAIPAPLDESAGESAGEQKESSDTDHRPQLQLHDGEAVSGPGWTLEAVETPGHISNHLCFAYPQASVLFSGDHVMRWSTSVISPPTGDLRAYYISLDKVAARFESTYWPTHGPAVRDPQQYVAALAEHRRHRTRQIVEALGDGPHTVVELVAAMYPGLDERLVKAAGRSVLAHLLALMADDQAESSGAPEDISSQFALR